MLSNATGMELGKKMHICDRFKRSIRQQLKGIREEHSFRGWVDSIPGEYTYVQNLVSKHDSRRDPPRVAIFATRSGQRIKYDVSMTFPLGCGKESVNARKYRSGAPFSSVLGGKHNDDTHTLSAPAFVLARISISH